MDMRIRKLEEILEAGKEKLIKADNQEVADEAEKQRLETNQRAGEASNEVI